MLKYSNISVACIRTLAISMMLIGLTAFTFGSIGGGSTKSRVKSLKVGFEPIRTTGGFTLKAGPNYRGSMILKETRSANYISYNSLITYQKGNSTYILPNKYKVSLAPNTSNSSRSNLQMLNLKIKLCR